MLTNVFSKVERVLAAITGLLLFTLNEVRMFNMLPRAPDPGQGQTYSAAVHVFGSSEQVYAAWVDIAARWGLAGLTVALCVWALADTFRSRATA